MTHNIDEINAYQNKDGSFQLEIHQWSDNGRATFIIPRAELNLAISGGYDMNPTIEITLKGMVDNG